MRMAVTALALAALAAGAPAVGRGQRARRATPQEEISQIEHALSAALVRGDAEPFRKVLDETCTVTAPDGRVSSKAELLALLRSGDLRFVSSEIQNLRVQAYAGTVIATYRTADRGSYRSEEFDYVTQWTDTFVRLHGRWQEVATHGSRVETP